MRPGVGHALVRLLGRGADGKLRIGLFRLDKGHLGIGPIDRRGRDHQQVPHLQPPRGLHQAEVSAFIAEHAHFLDEAGRQRLVRHGFLPEREMMTGIGTVPVQVPRVRDRGSNADGSKIKFRSSLIPPYLRKAKAVEELLPWLYLKGISTGDSSEALAALLGPDAEGLRPSCAPETPASAAPWRQYPCASAHGHGAACPRRR